MVFGVSYLLFGEEWAQGPASAYTGSFFRMTGTEHQTTSAKHRPLNAAH
jgi:hypothetical protein